MKAIELHRYRRIVFLTGAGVSVASGLPAYRGPGGLWSNPELAELSDRDALERRPDDVWRFFARAQTVIRAARPNAAHEALAGFEARLGDEQSLTVVTQNVDGLHQRAGSRNVIELHGSLDRVRCDRAGCPASAKPERFEMTESTFPVCILCGGRLRPDVTLFGELLPAGADWHSKRALRECDLFIAVGTSGTVAPAASFVRAAQYAGARTIFVNLEKLDPPDDAFGEEYLGRAEELLPVLLGAGGA